LGRTAVFARIDIHLGLDHLVIEVVALARALAHTSKNGIAAVSLGDIIDELHDDDRLADPGTAEEPDLAALGVGRKQIDDLDTGDRNLRLGRLFGVRGCRLVDGTARLCPNRTQFVYRLADDIDDAAETFFADGDGDRTAGVDDFLATHQAF